MSRAVKSADVHPHTGLNLLIAVWITNHVGTMWAAYIFAAIGIGSLVGVLTGSAVLTLVCGAVSSYFLQLVLLPVIMVGQSVQQAHADAMSEQNHAMLSEILRRLPPRVR